MKTKYVVVSVNRKAEVVETARFSSLRSAAGFAISLSENNPSLLIDLEGRHGCIAQYREGQATDRFYDMQHQAAMKMG